MKLLFIISLVFTFRFSRFFFLHTRKIQCIVCCKKESIFIETSVLLFFRSIINYNDDMFSFLNNSPKLQWTTTKWFCFFDYRWYCTTINDYWYTYFIIFNINHSETFFINLIAVELLVFLVKCRIFDRLRYIFFLIFG